MTTFSTTINHRIASEANKLLAASGVENENLAKSIVIENILGVKCDVDDVETVVADYFKEKVVDGEVVFDEEMVNVWDTLNIIGSDVSPFVPHLLTKEGWSEHNKELYEKYRERYEKKIEKGENPDEIKLPKIVDWSVIEKGFEKKMSGKKMKGKKKFLVQSTQLYNIVSSQKNGKDCPKLLENKVWSELLNEVFGIEYSISLSVKKMFRDVFVSYFISVIRGLLVANNETKVSKSILSENNYSGETDFPKTSAKNICYRAGAVGFVEKDILKFTQLFVEQLEKVCENVEMMMKMSGADEVTSQHITGAFEIMGYTVWYQLEENVEESDSDSDDVEPKTKKGPKSLSELMKSAYSGSGSDSEDDEKPAKKKAVFSDSDTEEPKTTKRRKKKEVVSDSDAEVDSEDE